MVIRAFPTTKTLFCNVLKYCGSGATQGKDTVSGGYNPVWSISTAKLGMRQEEKAEKKKKTPAQDKPGH